MKHLIRVAAAAPLWLLTQGAFAQEQPLSLAELYFELNNTDGDLGIHGRIGADDWKNLWIEAPNDAVLMQLVARNGIRRQGMSEMVFESAEPKFDELPPAEFFRRFPEGTYDIEALTLDGTALESEVQVSHVMPAPAVALQPTFSSCAAPVAAVAPVTIRWNPVTTSHPTIGTPGRPVQVRRYELAIERLDDSGMKMLAELPPGVTAFVVPREFTNSPGNLKFQITVKATNGNQTGEENCFVIR
jgi:hypothetical protein